MDETHLRILQVALLAPPAAALGFARGIGVSLTHGMIAGGLTCAFVVSALLVWGFLMGDLFDTIAGRQTARSPVPRYQKRVTPDTL
ncbi:MAG: hypothetical protein LUQ64_02125 [Methanomicrobiales archaeon]|nr:hypothetical protein [Methanomicrobiales archaeon]